MRVRTIMVLAIVRTTPSSDESQPASVRQDRLQTAGKLCVAILTLFGRFTSPTFAK